MTTICILCSNEHIENAREFTAKTWPNLSREHTFLGTPCSASGKGEPTHWFCSITIPEEKVQVYLDMQNYTIIEVMEIKPFLNKYGLQPIKSLIKK